MYLVRGVARPHAAVGRGATRRPDRVVADRAVPVAAGWREVGRGRGNVVRGPLGIAPDGARLKRGRGCPCLNLKT